jgi:hypothetical protein
MTAAIKDSGIAVALMTADRQSNKNAIKTTMTRTQPSHIE